MLPQSATMMPGSFRVQSVSRSNNDRFYNNTCSKKIKRIIGKDSKITIETDSHSSATLSPTCVTTSCWSSALRRDVMPAGQRCPAASCFGVEDFLIYLENDLTFPETCDKVELERIPLVVVEGVRDRCFPKRDKAFILPRICFYEFLEEK